MKKTKVKPKDETTPRHFDAEEHLVNGSTDVTSPAPAPAMSAHVAQVGADVPVLTTPAAVVEALGSPKGPPGLDAAATALAQLEQSAAPVVVSPAMSAAAEQIATHGHVFK